MKAKLMPRDLDMQIMTAHYCHVVDHRPVLNTVCHSCYVRVSKIANKPAKSRQLRCAAAAAIYVNNNCFVYCCPAGKQCAPTETHMHVIPL
jgi:hypothetical protein